MTSRGGRGGRLTLRPTNVNVEGLLTVLGQYLYRSPHAALRELVQNAHDSIVRRRLEDPGFAGGSIHVGVDPGAREVFVEDDGAGLTEDEIHRYLATIGSGYTRELRESSGSEDLIGLFGLGFVSAFVLAREVAVETTSHRDPSATHLYRSADGQRYTVSPMATAAPGTRVTVALKNEHVDLCDAAVLERILGHYCALLEVPLTVGDAADAVNAEPPPWRGDGRDEHPAFAYRRDLDFAMRMERRFEPLAVMRVAPRDGGDAHGLLWINGGNSYATSDQRRVGVYVRGMLLDDDARELLPTWAGFVSGAIESRSLTPTANREDLHRDAGYDAVRAQLQATLVEGLSALPDRQPEAWRRVLRRHNEALLGASLCDERLFTLLVDDVKLPTTDGDLTARDAVRAGGGRLHVAVDANDDMGLTLFRALRIPVARGERFAVLSFAHRYCRAMRARLVEVGSEKGEEALFTRAAVSEDDRDWLVEHLTEGDEQLVTSQFDPPELPVVAIVDRQAELKQLIESDEADRRMASHALRLARLHTSTIGERPRIRLHVNLASPAVRAVLQARSGNPDGALRGIRLLRSVKHLVGRAGEAQGTDALPRALEDVCAAVVSLCEAG